jgi:hypothetical protein
MNLRSLFFLLALTACSVAAEPALKDTPLAAIKGSVQLPEGWFIKEEGEDGSFTYTITREKVESETDPFTAGLILSVTTKVPERASMKPSEYANELLSSTQEESGGELKKSTDDPWQTFRTDYQIDTEGGGIHMTNYAKANDQTGTIYFVTWQSPENEEAKMSPIRDAVISSLKFDPSF